MLLSFAEAHLQDLAVILYMYLFFTEKRRGQSTSHPEPSGSRQHIPMYSDETPAFESPAIFDSFDEIELHHNERPKIVKTPKRNREGENTRVRSKYYTKNKFIFEAPENDFLLKKLFIENGSLICYEIVLNTSMYRV